MKRPPDRFRHSPVTNPARREARNGTAWAASSLRPKRDGNGLQQPARFSSVIVFTCGSNSAVAMALTVTPCAAVSAGARREGQQLALGRGIRRDIVVHAGLGRHRGEDDDAPIARRHHAARRLLHEQRRHDHLGLGAARSAAVMSSTGLFLTGGAESTKRSRPPRSFVAASRKVAGSLGAGDPASSVATAAPAPRSATTTSGPTPWPAPTTTARVP